MTIKITIEFKSVDEAIVALGKMVAAPGAPATAANAAPVAAASPRRGRSDKGQKRGEYKPRQQEGVPASAIPEEGKTTGNSASRVTESRSGDPAASSTVLQAPGNAVSAPATAEAAAPTAKSAAVLDAGTPTSSKATIGDKDEECQKVLGEIVEKRKLEAALALLSRYGVQKLRDIPKDMRDEFLQHAKLVAQGGAI